MGGKREASLYEVIWHTRRLFQRLASTADELHGDLGLNASQRAMLEFLARREPQTVPQIARERGVSRQHVQTLVNQLLDLGLVATQENPAHQRSLLMRRTDAGRRLFETARAREAKGLAVMAGQFDRADLETTARTLAAIDGYLQSADWREVMQQLTGGKER